MSQVLRSVWLAGDLDGARIDGVDAAQAPGKLAAPGTRESTDAQDLAAGHADADAVKEAVSREVAHDENRFTFCRHAVRPGGCCDAPADHHLDERLGRDVSDRQRAD